MIRDERGISSVEFVIVASVFFMLCFGVIDFSRAMWHWNAAAKATHVGVRFAVVNNMVSIAMQSYKGSVAAGQSIPAATVVADLGTDTFVCTNTGCNGNGDTGTSFDDIAFALIVAKMQTRYDRVEPENVVVEYRHIGLGFSGDPLSPDLNPAVTVRLVGMEFNFVTPGFTGIATLGMPAFRATMTGEDLTTL